jgi:hypothetical protein
LERTKKQQENNQILHFKILTQKKFRKRKKVSKTPKNFKNAGKIQKPQLELMLTNAKVFLEAVVI